MSRFFLVGLVGSWVVVLALLTEKVNSAAPQVFTNSFLVEFHDDMERADADKIARQHGFENVGSVSFGENTSFSSHMAGPNTIREPGKATLPSIDFFSLN
jgi:hypothetical protein